MRRSSVDGSPHSGHGTRFWALTLGSLGVVYGDIGTSPLYAVKESINAARGAAPVTPEIVLGITSLIVWALIIVVTIKYVVLILRADNNGEGGTLTLMALAQHALGRRVPVVMLLGIAGAALFYGDAVITPAISVLSAVEGLNLLHPAFERAVLPLSLAILTLLFVVQSHGTARMAAWFSPVMMIWFALLAVGGLVRIAEAPQILGAVSPHHGARFLTTHGHASFLALGSVFLAVTGAEALYADMGHFGRDPIRMAWTGLVLPALVVNYLGQGALLLTKPEAIENPFFLLYPSWALVPMVILATLATIIASQAVISGAYSVTQQAMQLGLLPRLEIRQTSASERGQVYIPVVNWLLLVAVLYLTSSFRTSSSLAAAYGVAVTGTMVVTVALGFIVVWRQWGWSWQAAALLMAPFLLIDGIFLSANLLKIAEGGWLPILIGTVLVVTMLTWRRGADALSRRSAREALPLQDFLALVERKAPDRIEGTAVFLTAHPEQVPTSLMHNLKHNKILHHRNIIVHVETANTPYVESQSRSSVRRLSERFSLVTLRFGYMDEPDVPRALTLCRKLDVKFEPGQASYFLSRRKLRPASRSELPRWQDLIFVWMAGRAADASQYFRIPTDRAIEVGTQVQV